MPSPRERVGSALGGRVLEIGPGSNPHPTAAGATVTYADRPVGGRDETWPELVGSPRGPSADVALDLDVDGLDAFEDDSFDAVVASHIVEHVANPVAALVEMARVVTPDGRLVLVVPDRLVTFDRGRAPTPAAHVLDEFEAGVTEVSTAHVAEFCAAIWALDPIHPEPVRAWHDPTRLDDELLELHRRRTIHVHCWTVDEFVALLAALAQARVLGHRLLDLYLPEDPSASPDEFGLVLSPAPATPDVGQALVSDCCDLFLSRPPLSAGRLGHLERSLTRDVPEWAAIPARRLADELERAATLQDELDRLHASRSAQVTPPPTTPLQRLRRLTGRAR